MKTYPESRLTDLLIEFDEMGFCPTTVCPNPEQAAIEWKEQVVKEIQKLQAENAELRARLEKAVELQGEGREMNDKINHPSHYTDGRKYETIDVIADNLTEEGFEGFCIGCVFKYISRYRKKNGVEDLKKAAWYLAKAIKTMEQEGDQ